jgi:hypothetical protein
VKEGSDGEVSEKSPEMRHFQILPCAEEPALTPSWASALARNDPTLLAKNDQHHTKLVAFLPVGKGVFLPHCKPSASQGPYASARERLARLGRSVPETERLTRAFGADDGKSRRTPTAWMIMLVHSLPHAESRSKSCSWCGSL